MTQSQDNIVLDDSALMRHRAVAAAILKAAEAVKDAALVAESIKGNPLGSDLLSMRSASTMLGKVARDIIAKLEQPDEFDPNEWKPDVLDPLSTGEWVVVRKMSRDDALQAVGFSKSALHEWDKTMRESEGVTMFPPDGVEPWPSKGAMIGPLKVRTIEHNAKAVYHDNGAYSLIKYTGKTKKLSKGGAK